MNVTELLAKDLNREIKVEVPKNDIEDKLISKLEDLKKTIQLKGFRPGKVPITHLKRVFL
jgi:trigger factor